MNLYSSSDTSIPTSTDNIRKEPSDVNLNEAARLREDKNRRLFSNDDMESVKMVDETTDDGSVTTATSRYREGHEPKSTKQQGEAMTLKVTKIYGVPATSTPLASTLNTKELMKNPPSPC